jgi:tetratricopeptide (TPR) repeat protein
MKLFVICCACISAAPSAWSQQPAEIRTAPNDSASAQNKQSAEANAEAEIDVAAALDAEAEVRFKQAEAAFNKTMKTSLYDPKHPERYVDRDFQKQLLEKSRLISDAVDIYMDVIGNYRSAKWGVASMTRIGMMLQDLADQLIAVPTPEGLAEDVRIAYKKQYTDYSIQTYDKAVALYTTVVQKGPDHGIDDEYVQEAKKRLAYIESLPIYVEHKNR